MRKLIVALAMTTAVCLASAAVAFADGAPPTQGVSQSAGTSQLAGAASSAVQVQPTNTNISVRIFSPGNDGNVTQTNSATSAANAGNDAGTSQSANQSQSGSGVQGAQQTASTDQAALALSEAKQYGASNLNTPVRIFSPGDGGSVSQSNTADSNAAAGNKAWTGQRSSQDGSSCGCSSTPPPIYSAPSSAPTSDSTTSDGPSSDSKPAGGSSGVQGAIQSADTQQAAAASSKAVQVDPSNSNISVRIFSPGDNGNVTQSNTVNSSANAGNRASTEQRASQDQAGSCGCQPAPKPTPPPCGCGSTPAPTQWNQPSATSDPSAQLTSDPSQGYQPESNQQPANSAAAPASSPAVGVQGAGQQASTKQLALAGSEADQTGASNSSDPVRIGSYGNDGNVTQTNSVSSAANAGNEAWTHQNADQSQGGSSCGCGGYKVQGAGQKAETDQGSLALSKAIQDFGRKSDCGCGSDGGSGNNASPVRVWSPGTDGNVTQTNSVDSKANAGNRAGTSQDAMQTSGGGGTQVQGVGQWATTLQGAFAGSLAYQQGASNDASPVRLWSPGGGGDVNQTNSASSAANAGNDAWTHQDAGQSIGGKKQCGCTGTPVQAVGQQAWTGQFGAALSGAFQLAPQNTSNPVRFKSPDGYDKRTQPCGCQGSEGPKGYPDGGSYGKQPCGCQGSDGRTTYPDGGSYGQGAPDWSSYLGSYGRGTTPDGSSYGGQGYPQGGSYGDKSSPSGGSVAQQNTAGSGSNGGNRAHTDQSAPQLT